MRPHGTEYFNTGMALEDIVTDEDSVLGGRFNSMQTLCLDSINISAHIGIEMFLIANVLR